MAHCVGGSQQVPYLDRPIARIHFTIDLTEQSNGLPVTFGLLFIQHDSRLVIASTGNDACYAFIMGTLTWEKRALFAKNHYRSRFDRFTTANVEVLGAIGIC